MCRKSAAGKQRVNREHLGGLHSWSFFASATRLAIVLEWYRPKKSAISLSGAR